MKIKKFKSETIVLKAADFSNNLLGNKVKLADGRVGIIKNVDAKTYNNGTGVFFAYGAFVDCGRNGTTVVTPNPYGREDLIWQINNGKFTFVDKSHNKELLDALDQFEDQFRIKDDKKSTDNEDDKTNGGKEQQFDQDAIGSYVDLTDAIPFTRDFQEWLSPRAMPVRVTVPSKLLRMFRRTFNAEPTSVVDSNRKTRGGYSIKFNISATCRLKDPNEAIPEKYLKYFKEGTTEIHNTGSLLKAIKSGDLTIAAPKEED